MQFNAMQTLEWAPIFRMAFVVWPETRALMSMSRPASETSRALCAVAPSDGESGGAVLLDRGRCRSRVVGRHAGEDSPNDSPDRRWGCYRPAP